MLKLFKRTKDAELARAYVLSNHVELFFYHIDKVEKLNPQTLDDIKTAVRKAEEARTSYHIKKALEAGYEIASFDAFAKHVITEIVNFVSDVLYDEIVLPSVFGIDVYASIFEKWDDEAFMEP